MLIEHHGQHRVDEDRLFLRGYHVQVWMAVNNGQQVWLQLPLQNHNWVV